MLMSHHSMTLSTDPALACLGHIMSINKQLENRKFIFAKHCNIA